MNSWNEQKMTLGQQLEADFRARRRRGLRPLAGLLIFICLASAVAVMGVVL